MRTTVLMGLCLLVVTTFLALLPLPAIAGIAGNALHFDGTNDYVSVPGFSMTTQALTVEAWVYIDQRPQNYGKIIDFGGPDAGNRFTLQTTPVGVNFSIDGGGLVKGTGNYVAASLNRSEWYHLAGTWESNGALHLYVNGVLVDAATYARPLLTVGSSDGHNIGKRYETYPSGQDDCFAGTIDELRVWNVVRTPEQIAANYNRLVAVNSPGLASYWRLDEGVGVVAFDSSGNHWSGILGGDGIGSDLPTWVESGAPIVPEPATISLLALGLGALAIRRRRR